MAGCLESSTLEPFALNMTALRVRLINFSKLQMAPHLNSGRNDRHFINNVINSGSRLPCYKITIVHKIRAHLASFFSFFFKLSQQHIIGADGQTVSELLPDAQVKEVSPPAHSRAQSVCVCVCSVLWPTVCIAAP